jgi:hypothetical protein
VSSKCQPQPRVSCRSIRLPTWACRSRLSAIKILFGFDEALCRCIQWTGGDTWMSRRFTSSLSVSYIWSLKLMCHLAECIRELNTVVKFVPFSNKQKQAPWPESTSELCRPSDSHLSAKLMPTFADRGVSRKSVRRIPYGRILGFLDRSRCFFSQVAPQLYSWCWVDNDPLLLTKSGSVRKRTRTSGSVVRNSDH